jgi:glycosyltransferase involved in cell wall biosynthesis
MVSCDIIIPTYNNAVVLPDTLNALFGQRVPASWSLCVIVSDDGSTDRTRTVVKNRRQPTGWRPTRVLAGAHGGPAAARNRALAHTGAHLIIFLGADIILRPGALAAHLKFHSEHHDSRDAALGMIKWDPRLNPSPLMEWMIHGGGQNDFDSLLGQAEADPRHFFYGSHISLKRAALDGDRFSTTYRTYGWEDVDLGRRLASRLTLYPLHEALGLHRHYYTPLDMYRRQFLVGQNLIVYQQHHPEASLLPQRSKFHRVKIWLVEIFGAGTLLRWVVARTAETVSTPRFFSAVAALMLWRGIYAKQFSTDK